MTDDYRPLPKTAQPRTARPGLIVLGFAAIYLIWGSTYLAIRIAVETLPPFSMAGIRFLVAGSVLFLVARRGHETPTWVQWRSAAIIGGFLLLGGNGGVVWAEQQLPSGITAVLVATVPVWVALIGAIMGTGHRLSLRDIVGVLVGFAGVVWLTDPFAGSSIGAVDRTSALVLLGASLSWSIGTIASGRVSLPKSPWLATSMEMLTGGALLATVGVLAGEWGRISPEILTWRAVTAMLYLIVLGSLVAFSAYVWLIGVCPASRVATYAYVNPVVAVLLGWALADEVLTARTTFAMVLILAAVVLITTSKSRFRKVPEEPGPVKLDQPSSADGVGPDRRLFSKDLNPDDARPVEPCCAGDRSG